jgi:FkbM family methyltransferase
VTELNVINLESILSAIPEILPSLHRGTPTYALLDKVAHDAVGKSGFADDGSDRLGEIGSITLPFREMGAITTLDLFGLDELILFSWYWANKGRYQRVADLGANVGLHSIVMSKIGWAVDSYEADPQIAEVLRANLELNNVGSVQVHNVAVSDAAGQSEFVRVLGNLTGSHLAGDKNSPYGQLERFVVPTVGIGSIMARAEFIKMDVEGSEARIVEATTHDDWNGTDVVLEIGIEDNAARIFAHLSRLGVRMFSQKNSWAKVETFDQLPFHHTQGLVFCSANSLPF